MTGFWSKISFAQSHAKEESTCPISGILRPELFSSSVLVERIRFDGESNGKCSSCSRTSRVDRSNLNVVTDRSEVGDSVV